MQIIVMILEGLAGMIWDIYWGLAFGFMLSSVIRAFVSTNTISSKLGKNNFKALSLSSFFGAVSSSCSYAAASMARTLLVKGSTWSNAVAFMVASTNLVFEIFIVIVSILGWAFFGAEIAGGILFIIISATLLAIFYPAKTIAEAEKHIHKKEDKAPKHATMHGHMHDAHRHDMKEGVVPTTFAAKIKTASSYFYMDVMMVGKDILVGVIVASLIMVLVPKGFWNVLFLTNNTSLPGYLITLWNVFIGELVAVVSFVCSVGNIVLASALWKGGISFGGVIAYILADLITIPMLAVYRTYYGTRSMLMLFLFLGTSIMITALLIDAGFNLAGWVPHAHNTAQMATTNIFEWNYKAFLNVIFIPLSVLYFFLGKRQSAMAMG